MMETAEGADEGVVEGQQHEDEILESRRLHILRAAIECVIKKTVHCMSLQNFVEIAKNANVNKTLSQQEERYLNKIYSKFQQVLEDAMKSDVDEYIENSGLLEAHERISRTIPENTSTSSPAAAWRPTGDPYQDKKSHEAESQVQHNKVLQGLVEEQEVKIQCLKQHITHKRLLTHQLLKRLMALQEDCIKISANESALQELFAEILTLLSREIK